MCDANKIWTAYAANRVVRVIVSGVGGMAEVRDVNPTDA